MQLVSRKPAETAPQRMGPLAKLPVFLNLAGKRAVVVGGSAAAAWKCELLAAAGARVEVYAETLEPDMAFCIANASVDNPIRHHARPWAGDIFADAAVALANIDSEVEAEAFACAARAAGVLVNIIDKPAFCQFQFGSIVNRSPVIVGISTDGAAPILAQAIRQRIETLLPPALAAWGELARQLRETVMTRLAKGAPRRRFWERFSNRAFGAAPTEGEHRDLASLIDSLAMTTPSHTGRVTLVGAGPGDAELLTLKAVRALQSADVILFDDLVSDEVLELARREAKRMLVGKRGKRESCSQADINELMVKLARQGKHVVRLKSGDPMIFGRAGEEITELAKHGIVVDVVPGITAALAAAAALGVSLTHRDHAHSVRFVTGHARNGELPIDIDWRGLADPATTLMFYMGGRTAPAIAKNLIAAGLPAVTPVVVAAGVSRKEETRWYGDLLEMSHGISPIDHDQPVLIGIGRTFVTVGSSATHATNGPLISVSSS
jgi:uroporphyrin-III C-methyltransferase/precorrin-2 dehydrogenase/sirohydrochlorin ferrochelatase